MVQAIEHNLFAILDRQNRPPEDIAFVRKAYEFAYKAHDGQLRKSEDPYIIHPVEVACLLAVLNGDKPIIAAGLMHDVLEDCDVKAQEMAEIFGKDVN